MQEQGASISRYPNVILLIMILSWDVYEIKSSGAVLHGVKLRGRIRKFTIEKNISCIAENASDEENVVRFALLASSDPKQIIDFIKDLIPDAVITRCLEDIANPVLSKLKVNDSTRYEI